MYLFFAFIFRRLAEEKLRSLVTILGIAIGISAIVGVRLSNDSSLRGFKKALDTISGKTSLELISPGVGLDENRLLELDWLENYGELSPIIDGEILVQGQDSTEESLRVLGVDILKDGSFRDYELTNLINSNTPSNRQEMLGLLTDPRSIFITEKFARKHSLKIDSKIEVLIGDRLETLLVAGLLLDRGPAKLLAGNFALMDIAAAQWLLGRLGQIDRVDLMLHPEIPLDQTEEAISRKLPSDVIVQKPSKRESQTEKMLEAFHFNLTALSYIALLVGLFLIYNTASLSVITRRQEIGILRAVGATRQKILSLFLAEAGFFSVIGSLLGLLLGKTIALGAIKLTSSTVERLYIRTAAEPAPLTIDYIILAIIVGVPLSLLAAIVPALEASRIAPVTAVQKIDWVKSRFQLSWQHKWLSLILIFISVSLIFLGINTGIPFFGYAACLVTVFAAALLVPLLLFSLRLFNQQFFSRIIKVESFLAISNLQGYFPRIYISVAALAVSLSMLVSISVMIGSFRETVQYWVQQTLRADLFITPGAGSNLPDRATLSTDIEKVVALNTNVAAIDHFVSFDITYNDRLVVLGAGNFPVLLERGGLLFKSPSEGRSAMRAAIGKDAVLVSESFSLKNKKGVGDQLKLPTNQGTQSFRIAAVYYDYSKDRGIIVMDQKTFKKHYGFHSSQKLAVYLKENIDPNVVRSEILSALDNKYRISINTNASLKREVFRIFDSTFSITYALELIAIFIAILGIASTLLSFVLDRKRELRILRWIGIEQKQLWKMIIVEATLLGSISQAIGVTIGLILSLILVYVINVQSFGWTIQFHIPTKFLLQSSLLILLVTALSGIYPAYRSTSKKLDRISEANPCL